VSLRSSVGWSSRPVGKRAPQADVLVARFESPKDLDRDMLRAARASALRSGKQAEGYMNSGRLVPDEVVIGFGR